MRLRHRHRHGQAWTGSYYKQATYALFLACNRPRMAFYLCQVSLPFRMCSFVMVNGVIGLYRGGMLKNPINPSSIQDLSVLTMLRRGYIIESEYQLVMFTSLLLLLLYP